MAQSVKRLTLDFGLGHDLVVRGIEPCVGDHCLGFSLSAPPLLSLSLSLSLKISNKNKIIKKKFLKESSWKGSVSPRKINHSVSGMQG